MKSQNSRRLTDQFYHIGRGLLIHFVSERLTLYIPFWPRSTCRLISSRSRLDGGWGNWAEPCQKLKAAGPTLKKTILFTKVLLSLLHNLTYFPCLSHGTVVNVKSVRIGDVVMPVVPAENPELVPEVEGPFYEGSQVKRKKNEGRF